MARINYGAQKRAKELKRLKKREEKMRNRLERKKAASAAETGQAVPPQTGPNEGESL